MHANNDSLGVRSADPFPGADAEGRLFGFCQSPNQLSPSGRSESVGLIARRCPELIVASMQKVACRGEQATASAPQRAALGNTPAHARRGSADRGGLDQRLDFEADRLPTCSDRVLCGSASGREGDLIIRQIALAVAIPFCLLSLRRRFLGRFFPGDSFALYRHFDLALSHMP